MPSRSLRSSPLQRFWRSRASAAAPPLLLTATFAAGVLAVFPFSLHSFVVTPVAVVYALAYARLSTFRHHQGAILAVVGCPVLLVTAFVVLILQEHPACYEQLATGEGVIDRDPGDTLSGTSVMGPDSNVVATGCTSDIIVWWEATASLALTNQRSDPAVGPGGSRPAAWWTHFGVTDAMAAMVNDRLHRAHRQGALVRPPAPRGLSGVGGRDPST